jgi:hypothetical protein
VLKGLEVDCAVEMGVGGLTWWLSVRVGRGGSVDGLVVGYWGWARGLGYRESELDGKASYGACRLVRCICVACFRVF